LQHLTTSLGAGHPGEDDIGGLVLVRFITGHVYHTVTIHSLQEPRKKSKYPTSRLAESQMAVDWLLASHLVPL